MRLIERSNEVLQPTLFLIESAHLRGHCRLQRGQNVYTEHRPTIGVRDGAVEIVVLAASINEAIKQRIRRRREWSSWAAELDLTRQYWASITVLIISQSREGQYSHACIYRQLYLIIIDAIT